MVTKISCGHVTEVLLEVSSQVPVELSRHDIRHIFNFLFHGACCLADKLQLRGGYIVAFVVINPYRTNVENRVSS